MIVFRKYLALIILVFFSQSILASSNINFIYHNDSIPHDVLLEETQNRELSLASVKPVQKVVIDAGHGGKDSGCSGTHSQEKHIALAIALEFGRKINYYHPEIEVIYTREQDVFIPLFKRIDMANKSNADLFISIHCNSFVSPNTSGTETYVMGLHKSQENLSVAKRENASILMEKDFRKNYDGYDPYSPEGHALLALLQTTHLEQSIRFAAFIEKSFAKRTKLKSRGVKQAGFVVLRQATMPAVLVEAGFLTNIKDQSILTNRIGQLTIADAITKAFTEYVRFRENQVKELKPNEYAENIPFEKPDQTRVGDMSSVDLISVDKSESVISTPKQSESKVETKKIESSQNVKSSKTDNTSILKTDNIAIVYKIQVAAARRKGVNTKKKPFSQLSHIEINKEEGMYKYLTGHHTNMEDAVAQKNALRKMGFRGAFVVAYKGDIRVKK